MSCQIIDSVTTKINSSQVIRRGTCLLKSLVISCVTDAGSVILYEGMSANAKEILRLYCAANDAHFINFVQPVLFTGGMYAVIDDTNTHVTLQLARNDFPENS